MKPDPDPEKIPPAVKGLAAVSLWNDVASEMVYPLLPAFITGTLGGGATILGALDGAAELMSAALKWITGRLADRPRWRAPLILGGYAIAVLTRPVIALASSAWQVVGLRVVDRIGKGVRTAPRDTLIAAISPSGVRGRAFGLHRAADHFGAVVGSLLAWWLLTRGASTQSVIGWSIVPGLVAVLILAVVLRRTPAPVLPPVAASQADVPPPLWSAVAALAAIVLARMPEALLLLRLQDLGVLVRHIALVWALLHVIRSASAYPGGWLSDRLGPRGIVAAGTGVFAIVTLMLARAHTSTAGIAAFLALGLVAGLSEPAERALVARLSPHRPGSAFGAYHAITGFAALPAAVLFGWLYEAHNAAVALLVSSLATVAALCVWVVVAPRAKFGE